MPELKVIMLKNKGWLIPADPVTGEYMDELPETESRGAGIEDIVTKSEATSKQVRTAKQRAS